MNRLDADAILHDLRLQVKVMRALGGEVSGKARLRSDVTENCRVPKIEDTLVDLFKELLISDLVFLIPLNYTILFPKILYVKFRLAK